MSTAQQFVNDGTLAANRTASGLQGIDSRRRRFALNPNIYMAMLDARESGRQEMLLPVGLVTFRTTAMLDDDFDNVERNGKNPSARHQSTIREYPAMYFLSNALTRYGEQGMRELSCLTLMDDAYIPQRNEKGQVTKEEHRRANESFPLSAQGYFAALWPSFADIGHQCPEDLKECVSCRLWLIGDPANGESMHEELVERASKLADQDKVAELRQQLFEALSAYQSWLVNKWAGLLGERADRKSGGPGMAKFGPGEHHVRRNLHEVEPSEAATAAGFGAEVAAGQAEGFQKLADAFAAGKSGDNTDLMRMMIERQNKTDDALASLAESVKTLVDKQAEK